VLVVPEPSGVGSVRDAIGLAVCSFRRALGGIDELAPRRPLGEVAVQRLEVAGFDVGVDEEGVFVDHVGGGPRRAQHQGELGVVVVLGRDEREELDLLARVRLLELGLHTGQEVGHHLALAELLVGHLDGRVPAGRVASRGGPAAGRQAQPQA